MSPLIKKEIRLLLPAWTSAMLLAIVPPWMTAAVCATDSQSLLWLSQSWLSLYIPLFATIGGLYLGVTSFGQEISSGAFTLLLSQPARRRRIWRVKTTTLSIAFFTVWLAALISVCCLYFIFYHLEVAAGGVGVMPLYALVSYNHHAFEFLLGILTISLLTVFSGGLWGALLFRQVTLAFWVTLLTPMAITTVIGMIFDFTVVPNPFITGCTLLALVIYAIFGFFYARKLFFNAQDIQWTGGEVSFEWRRKSADTMSVSASHRPRHWFSALVMKEIQLHQVNLAIAVVLLSVQVASVVTDKLHPRFRDPDITFILEAVWVLWLAMPLVIGGSAIAEERKLGVFDSQKCLPVSRGRQLAVKFAIALALGVLLGGLPPALFAEHGYSRPVIFAAAAAILVLSFFASSLTRSTLQAIGVTFLIAAAIGLYEFFSIATVRKLHSGLSDIDGLEFLKLFFEIPILLLIFAALIIWNFNWLHENRKLWRRNLSSILIAFGVIFALTNAVYFRLWEFLAPLETVPGPIRLNDSTSIKFAWDNDWFYATLPDGRLWSERYTYDVSGSHLTGPWTWVIRPKNPGGNFVAGSNWIAVAADNFESLGIRSDGTLWSLQQKWSRENNGWKPSTIPLIIRQLGSDMDWAQVAGGNNLFWILKKDGTLWAWGTNETDWRGEHVARKLKLDLAMLPDRISDQTDWIKVLSSSGVRALKSDGSLWEWEDYGKRGLHPIFGPKGPRADVAFMGAASYALIATNGELDVFGGFGRGGIQRDAKWKKVAFARNDLLAIRDDGTLWRWSPYWKFGTVKPVQLGIRSDWVQLKGDWYSAFALAADGTLWSWDNMSDHFWLAPSRKPIYIGDIFEAASSAQERTASQP